MLVGPHPHSLARPQALVQVKGCFDASMRPQAGPSLAWRHPTNTAVARLQPVDADRRIPLRREAELCGASVLDA